MSETPIRTARPIRLPDRRRIPIEDMSMAEIEERLLDVCREIIQNNITMFGDTDEYDQVESICQVIDPNWPQLIDDADDNHNGELSAQMVATRMVASRLLTLIKKASP